MVGRKEIMRIFIEDSFDSAHYLPNVPDGHKCAAMHGHTYRIRLEVEGIVGNVSGWVIDYAEVKAVWETVKAQLDHKCLNDILQNPTCEVIAFWIRDLVQARIPGLSGIELRETERCGVILDC